MKNKLPLLLIVIGVVTALCAALIVSCAIAPSDDESPSTNESTINTASEESITIAEHLAATEPSEHSSSEEESTNPPSNDNATESTATETETREPEPPAPSLEYVSNGNGTCSLAGIGTYTESYISIPAKNPDGDVVISISEQAFMGNNTIKAVEIPSTVMTIGDSAFSNCESLIYISVSKDNAIFTDIGGVLYTKNLATLLCYPSGSGVSSVSIPASVEIISPMAFYNCNSLKSIIYKGSGEDWSKINIGEQNFGLYTAAVIFDSENLQ